MEIAYENSKLVSTEFESIMIIKCPRLCGFAAYSTKHWKQKNTNPYEITSDNKR